MPVSEALFRFLLDNKGQRLQTIQKTTLARLHMERTTVSVQVSGLQAHMEAARTAIEQANQEMTNQTVVLPATAAQIDVLMDNKATIAKRLQTEHACSIDVDRVKGEVRILAPEDKRETARAAVEAVFAGVRVETLSLHSRQAALFVGVKGKNINALRKESGAQLELRKEDEQLTISGEEAAVTKAKELVQAWLDAHAVREMDAEETLAFAVVVGPKGARRKELEKELGVEIFVGTPKEGRSQIAVLGETAKCEAAVTALQARMDQYAKENATVAFTPAMFRNAPELRRNALTAKGKELEVTFVLQERQKQVAVQGAEEKLPAALAFLTAVKEQYAEFAELPLNIPKSDIGTLVGKNGENIRRLQESLSVRIDTDKDKVTLWGLQAKLEAAKAGILADLEERVMVVEKVKCTVKQVAFLTDDRHALANRIQEATGAFVRIPEELPVIGATEVTVRGNKRQVTDALPLVREALQGHMRETLTVPADHLTAVLDAGVLQIQRLALEARCRIQPEREQGTVLVVGPKEGVMLVLRRFWEQLAAVVPAVYYVRALEEAEGYGLEKEAKKLISQAEAKGLRLAVSTSLAFLSIKATPEGEEKVMDMEAGKQWLQEVCERVAKENRVIALTRERVPFLIGTRGARISKLRKDSGASLEIVHEDAVLVQGKPENVEKAVELVKAVMEDYEATHRTLTIDPEYIGVLVGSRGSNLQRLRQQYFTSINVGDDGQVTISGSQAKQVQDTVEAIEKYLEEVRQREGMEEGEAPRLLEIARDSRRENPRTARRENQGVREERNAQPSAESVWEKLKHAPVLGKGGSASYM